MPAALLGAAATLLSAGNAQAAMEVANIAAGDGRGGILAGLALPAVGWVLFNIAGGEPLPTTQCAAVHGRFWWGKGPFILPAPARVAVRSR